MILGIVFALLCSFCWFGFDVARQQTGEHMSATGALAALMILQIPLLLGLLVAGHMVGGNPKPNTLHHLMLGGFPGAIPGGYWWQFGASLGLNIVANVLFLRAVQISPLSLTTPYLGLTPAFTALIAWPMAGQQPRPLGWGGIVVVCVCAFLLNAPRGGGWAGPLRALIKERGSLYMIIVALVWSVTPLLDKGAAEGTSILWHVFMLNASLGVVYLGWRLCQDGGPGPVIRSAGKCGWAVGLGTVALAGAMLFQFGAYPWIDVAVVETLKRCVGVTGAMVVGYFFLGEDVTWWRAGVAGAMVCGVAMVLIR